MHLKLYGPLRDLADQVAVLNIEAATYEDLRRQLSEDHGKLARLLPTVSGAQGYIRLFLDGNTITPEEISSAQFSEHTVIEARMSVSGG